MTTVTDGLSKWLAAGMVVVGAVAIVLAPSWWALIPTSVLLVVAVTSGRDGTQRSTKLAATCWASVGFFSAASFGVVWPIPQLVGLLAAAVYFRREHWERPTWLDAGSRDRAAWLLAAGSVPLTSIALVAFIASGRTDLDAASDGLQSLPPWALPLVGLGFVLVNPTVEEVLFRGVLQEMVTEISARPGLGIAAQGVAFGAIHLHGVPGGLLGMVMATSWGIVLGIVRHCTGSLRLVWVVHVLANTAIYTTVVLLALDDGLI